jgi:hypothetical protein
MMYVDETVVSTYVMLGPEQLAGAAVSVSISVLAGEVTGTPGVGRGLEKAVGSDSSLDSVGGGGGGAL